jgi:hypothetical protein
MYLPTDKNKALILKSHFIAMFSSIVFADSVPMFNIITPAHSSFNVLILPSIKFHLMNVIFSAWSLRIAQN